METLALRILMLFLKYFLIPFPLVSKFCMITKQTKVLSRILDVNVAPKLLKAYHHMSIVLIDEELLTEV